MGVTISMKAIKAKKLSVDAIRLEILNALRREGTQHRRILARTVTTWRNKPKFESLIGLTRKDMTVLTGPTGSEKAVQLWEYSDLGTRAHVIRARRAPALRFRWPSTAKTSVGKFKSGPGRRGRNWARKLFVRHPGTKARGWSKLLTKRRKKPFTKAMLAAVKKGASKSFA